MGGGGALRESSCKIHKETYKIFKRIILTTALPARLREGADLIQNENVTLGLSISMSSKKTERADLQMQVISDGKKEGRAKDTEEAAPTGPESGLNWGQLLLPE